MQKSMSNLSTSKNQQIILLLNSWHDILQDVFVFEESMRHLNLGQQARILKKKSHQDRCKALCNQLLQITGISMTTGLPHTKLNFQYGVCGKPVLIDIDELTFSMSDGEHYVAQYISKVKGYEVGIDLASTSDYCGDQDLNHFVEVFSLQEFENLAQCPSSKKALLFTYIWSLKECYSKFTGLGLNSKLQNINFGKLNLFDTETTLKRRIDQKEMFFYSRWIAPGEVVTVCHESNPLLDQNPHVYYLTLQEVLSELQ